LPASSANNNATTTTATTSHNPGGGVRAKPYGFPLYQRSDRGKKSENSENIGVSQSKGSTSKQQIEDKDLSHSRRTEDPPVPGRQSGATKMREDHHPFNDDSPPLVASSPPSRSANTSHYRPSVTSLPVGSSSMTTNTNINVHALHVGSVNDTQQQAHQRLQFKQQLMEREISNYRQQLQQAAMWLRSAKDIVGQQRGEIDRLQVGNLEAQRQLLEARMEAEMWRREVEKLGGVVEINPMHTNKEREYQTETETEKGERESIGFTEDSVIERVDFRQWGSPIRQ